MSLTNLTGARVVLYFYPADDTPGCTREACQFNGLLDEFRALDVPVYGVSPDDATTHQAFRMKYDLRFTLLGDPATTTMQQYGAFGDKVLYGKKVTGVIRSTFVVGPKGRVEHTWYGPRTEGHAARVLARLRGGS